MQEGEWNDKSEAFAQIQVLCANCYDEVRRRNLANVDGAENGINKTWFLDNVLDLHDDYPETFQILDDETRQSLQPGDYVKLPFLLPAADESEELVGERMWIILSRVDHVGYFGELDSTPYTPNSISLGEKVLFGPEHVVDVIRADKKGTLAPGKDKIINVRHNIPNAHWSIPRDNKS